MAAPLPWSPPTTTFLQYAADAPRARPLTYPGSPPPTSVVQLLDAEPVILTPAAAGTDGTGVGSLPLGSSKHGSTVDGLLASLGAAVVADRVPVLAIGSNACGAQMRHKAHAESFALGIPLLQATMVGARITHSSFLSSLGYVPATLAPAPGEVGTVHVQFLDADQVAALDRTEIGYQRRWLPAETVGVTLAGGKRLAGTYAYVSDGGTLGDPGDPGDPDGSDGSDGSDATPLGDSWPLMPQPALFARLRAASPTLSGLLADDEESVTLARTDAGWRRAVNAALVEAALVLPEVPF
ncbi:hypothetical protein [Nocardioides sp.]|uniref:hypothetical protein n=1 Tax=Nocardioides sp. TaxID=35761 RepID=UPI0026312CA6|nr:hypothetical protein [Nocardioides sp.]